MHHFGSKISVTTSDFPNGLSPCDIQWECREKGEHWNWTEKSFGTTGVTRIHLTIMADKCYGVWHSIGHHTDDGWLGLRMDLSQHLTMDAIQIHQSIVHSSDTIPHMAFEWINDAPYVDPNRRRLKVAQGLYAMECTSYVDL